MIWTVFWECLVHQDLICSFRKEGFSGFELRDATVRFLDGSMETELYKELIVTGWGGRARPESGIRLLKQCDRCGSHWHTLLTVPEAVFNQAEWTAAIFSGSGPFPRLTQW